MTRVVRQVQEGCNVRNAGLTKQLDAGAEHRYAGKRQARHDPASALVAGWPRPLPPLPHPARCALPCPGNNVLRTVYNVAAPARLRPPPADPSPPFYLT